MNDYDGQMIFGDLGGLKLPDIFVLQVRKTPEKSHPGNLSRPGIEPGPAARQPRMLPLVLQRWTPKWVKLGTILKSTLGCFNPLLLILEKSRIACMCRMGGSPGDVSENPVT